MAATTAAEATPLREAPLLVSSSGLVVVVPRGAPTPPASLSSMPTSPEGESASAGRGEVAIGVRTLSVAEPDGAAAGAESAEA